MPSQTAASGQLGFGEMFDARPNRRLFLGLWPDAEVADRLIRLTQGLRHDGIIRGRPVDPDRLHLTLFHLGDFVDQIPPSLIPATQAACAGMAAQAFDVSFDRIVGTRKHALLWPSDELAALRAFRADLGAGLAAAGVRLTKPAFSPHVTLSYDPCDAPETAIDPIGWRVREFHLVESLLGQHRHIRLGSWRLG